MSTGDVYYADPGNSDDEALDEARALLCESERERAARFRFERDRRLYLVAHALLRRALGERLRLTPSAVAFQHNAHGRPELDAGVHAGSGLRFSLAHAHGMAVCALATACDVGVDVEPIERNVPMEVAKRFFAPSELDDLLGQPEGGRGDRFFTYWTLKEAYVKARGIGLSLPVAKAVFRVGEHVEFEPHASLEPNPEAWQFQSFQLGSSHRVALAVQSVLPLELTLHAR